MFRLITHPMKRKPYPLLPPKHPGKCRHFVLAPSTSHLAPFQQVNHSETLDAIVDSLSVQSTVQALQPL